LYAESTATETPFEPDGKRKLQGSLGADLINSGPVRGAVPTAHLGSSSTSLAKEIRAGK
jgi:hypothetical protein